MKYKILNILCVFKIIVCQYGFTDAFGRIMCHEMIKQSIDVEK